MPRAALIALTAAALTAAITTEGIAMAQVGEAPQQPTASSIEPLMRMKLDKSQAILEGLVLEDLPLVAKNARALKLLSLESGWNVIQTEEYAEQSRQFRLAADRILKAVTENDTDGAATAHADLTLHCVKCHSYMRKHRSANAQ